MSAKALFLELAPDYSPKHDPWGHAMGAFFDVAGEAYSRHLPLPAAWGYSPGPLGPAIDPGSAEVLATATDDDLIRVGHFLHRLTGRIDRAGLSY